MPQLYGFAVRDGPKESSLDLEAARKQINTTIDTSNKELRVVNIGIHSNPELAFKEHKAHDTLTEYLESKGFTVTRHAYGLHTSFEAEVGDGGHLVIFCAEYDALPAIGHACGHNLIATSSLAAFLGAAEALRISGTPGRIRILGTPAEEGGGGKVVLLKAGAFDDRESGHSAAAAIMAHPTGRQMMLKDTDDNLHRASGLAGMKLIANQKLEVEFYGKTAHAAGQPWDGINALDAAVAGYNNVSMLRQQIQPDERIHGVIEVGGTVPNVIAEYTRLAWFIRSPTIQRVGQLMERVKACFEAAAVATGCSVKQTISGGVADLCVNKALCNAYVEDMAVLGETIVLEQEQPFNGSTDMGDVSHYVPSFHGGFVIPAEDGVVAHNPSFCHAAGQQGAHEEALKCAKGMAMLAMRVLGQPGLAEQAAEDFGQIHHGLPN